MALGTPFTGKSTFNRKTLEKGRTTIMIRKPVKIKRSRVGGDVGEKYTYTSKQEPNPDEAVEYCADCGHKFGQREEKHTRMWSFDTWCKDCDKKRP